LPRKRIVLDADISWKLAHELQKRGRTDATALKIENLDTLKDGAVLKTLAAAFGPCVLVTWDNKMPKVHAADVRHHSSTLAVVNRTGFRNWAGTEDSYVRDVIHRWLHRIEHQEDQVVLYSTSGPRLP